MAMPLNDSEYRFQPPSISDLLAPPFASLLAGGVQPGEALQNVMQKFAPVQPQQIPQTRPNYDQMQLDALEMAHNLSRQAIAQLQPVQAPERRLSPMRPGETGLVALAGLLGRALGVDNRTLAGLGQGYVGTRQAQADQEYQRQLNAAQAEQLVQQRKAQMLQNDAQRQMALAKVFGDRAASAEEQSGKERLVGMQIDGEMRKAVLGGNIESILQQSKFQNEKALFDLGNLYKFASGIADRMQRRQVLMSNPNVDPAIAMAMGNHSAEDLKRIGDQLEQEARIKQIGAETESTLTRTEGDKIRNRMAEFELELARKYGFTEKELDIAAKRADIAYKNVATKMYGRGGGGGAKLSDDEKMKALYMSMTPDQLFGVRTRMMNQLDRLSADARSLGISMANAGPSSKVFKQLEDLMFIETVLSSSPEGQKLLKAESALRIAVRSLADPSWVFGRSSWPSLDTQKKLDKAAGKSK